jgi:hypothetical protein
MIHSDRRPPGGAAYPPSCKQLARSWAGWMPLTRSRPPGRRRNTARPLLRFASGLRRPSARTGPNWTRARARPQQKISGHLRSEQATRHRHTPSRAAASSNQGPREAPDRCTVPRGPPHLQNGPVCTRAAIRAEPARAEGHLRSVTIAGRGRRAVPADLRDRRLNAANQPGHADQVDLCADVVRICRICATPRDAVYAVATTSQMSAPERTRR